MKNYYQILGLKYSASDVEIKEAYRKLAHKFHPDKNSGDKFFENHFREIQEAYETLSNKNKKILFDYELNTKNKGFNHNKDSRTSNDRNPEDKANESNSNEIIFSLNLSKLFTQVKQFVLGILKKYFKFSKSKYDSIIEYFAKNKVKVLFYALLALIPFIAYNIEGGLGLATVIGFYFCIALGFSSLKDGDWRGILLFLGGLFLGYKILTYVGHRFDILLDKEIATSDNNSISVDEAIENMNEALADTAAVFAPKSSLYGSESPSAIIDNLSKYSQNQLSNGASPFNECFGSGKTGGNAYIVFDNGNKTDVVVCLTDYYSGATIRNEYIRAGEKYKVRNIPSGTYTIKGYYGNGWNPNKQNFCGTQGGFEQNEHFSKSDGIGDLIKIENTSRSYTTGTITLYSVANGNMGTESINENEFFK